MVVEKLRVFISYAWEDDVFKSWVERLAISLKNDGIEARLDKWHRKPGQSITGFMSSEIEDADKVLVVCSPEYNKRVAAVDRGETISGVGYEWTVLSTDIFQSSALSKAVGVIGKGNMDNSVPMVLKNQPVFDLTLEITFAQVYEHLFVELTDQRSSPPHTAKKIRTVRPKVLEGLSSKGVKQRHNIPLSRNHDFVGRDKEFKYLHTALRAKGPVALIQPVSLSGLGGIGKTQMAVEYAYRHLDDYEKVLWVDAAGQETPLEFLALAKLLGTELSEQASVSDNVELIRHALEDGSKYLLILDNIEKSAVSETLIPRDGRTSVLITTRRTDLLQYHRIVVDVLPEDKALELLCKGQCYVEEEHEAAVMLCEELGWLTLAIDVAGRMLSIGLRKPSDILESLWSRGSVAWSENIEYDSPFNKKPQLSILFEDSYALLLNKKSSGRMAQNMLRLAGWFAPVGISISLLQSAIDEYEEETDASNDIDDLVRHAAEQLVLQGFARVEEDSSVSFHRVVRDYARHKSGTKEKSAVHTVLSELAHSTTGDAAKLLSILWLRPHLESMLSDLDGRSTNEHIEIAARLAQHYWHCGQYAEAMRVTEFGLAVVPDDETKAWLLSEKSDAARAMGNYKDALRYSKKAFVIKEKVLGKEHSSTAITLNAIGQTLHRQGKYEEALDYYQRSLAIKEKVLGKEHPSTAITLNAIGQTLHSKGKYEEALSYYQRDLVITEKVLGEEHPETAITLNAIGQTLHSKGKYEEALGYYKRSLVIKEKVLGKKHPSTAITLNAIGQTLHSKGKYEEALGYYKRSLVIKEKVLGKEHPEIAITLNGIGQTLHSKGKYEEALDYYKRDLVITEKVLGEEHPETASTLNAIGQTFHRKGKYKEALGYYKRSLVIKEKVLGKEHPSTAITLNAIGQTLQRKGKYEEALGYYKRSLVIKEKVLGKEHPETAIIQFEIGRCMLDDGQSSGRETMKTATGLLERFFGSEHPTTKAAKSYL